MFTNRYSYISGVFDLFFPLKNSGSALRSIAWTLKETKINCYIRTLLWLLIFLSWQIRIDNYFLSKQVILDENTFQMLCVVTVPVIVKPSSIARDNDMMCLFSDIILMKIWSLHWFSFHTRGTFFFLLETHKRKANHECCSWNTVGFKHLTAYW